MTDTTEIDVSIVIATFDAAATLRACLESVLEQEDVRFEVLVSDGGSRDDTVAIIESVNDRIAWHRSERDRGIYDAWNHALEHARGTWVLFFGADDVLASPHALAGLLDRATEDTDLVCGQVQYLDGDGRRGPRYGAPWNARKLRWRQAIAHPATLHRCSLFERFGHFDADLRIAGDYDFLLRVAPHVHAAWHPEVVALLGADGVSKTQYARIRSENFAVQCRNAHSGPLRATAWRVLTTAAAVRRLGR